MEKDDTKSFDFVNLLLNEAIYTPNFESEYN